VDIRELVDDHLLACFDPPCQPVRGENELRHRLGSRYALP
jgi:hypothetical protein